MTVLGVRAGNIVIPAKAGIHSVSHRKYVVDRLDSRLCGNDKRLHELAHYPSTGGDREARETLWNVTA
jgi:hypothetical protein